MLVWPHRGHEIVREELNNVTKVMFRHLGSVTWE